MFNMRDKDMYRETRLDRGKACTHNVRVGALLPLVAHSIRRKRLEDQITMSTTFEFTMFMF
jgi:hypothetical protein